METTPANAPELQGPHFPTTSAYRVPSRGMNTSRGAGTACRMSRAAAGASSRGRGGQRRRGVSSTRTRAQSRDRPVCVTGLPIAGLETTFLRNVSHRWGDVCGVEEGGGVTGGLSQRGREWSEEDCRCGGPPAQGALRVCVTATSQR